MGRAIEKVRIGDFGGVLALRLFLGLGLRLDSHFPCVSDLERILQLDVLFVSRLVLLFSDLGGKTGKGLKRG